MKKYNYQPIETEELCGMRWYLTPKGGMPSITTILGISETDEKKVSLDRWRNGIGHLEADTITQEAADKGTAVHLMVERFLKGADPYFGIEVPEHKQSFNAIKIPLKNINNIYGQEEALYSEELGIAGRFDCIAEYKGVPSIIDIKTSRRIKSRAEIKNYELQLTFYSIAHNELFGTNINQGIIIMSSAGMPQVFRIDCSLYKQELIDRIGIFWDRIAPLLQD